MVDTQLVDLIATIAAHGETCPYVNKHPRSCLKAIRTQAAMALRLLDCEEEKIIADKVAEILQVQAASQSRRG